MIIATTTIDVYSGERTPGAYQHIFCCFENGYMCTGFYHIEDNTINQNGSKLKFENVKSWFRIPIEVY